MDDVSRSKKLEQAYLFYEALGTGDLDAVARYLDARPEWLHGYGWIDDRVTHLPLDTAAFQGDLPLLELLLARGADVEQRSPGGHGTALAQAAWQARQLPMRLSVERGNRHFAVVRRLLRAGADPNRKHSETEQSGDETYRDFHGRGLVEALEEYERLTATPPGDSETHEEER